LDLFRGHSALEEGDGLENRNELIVQYRDLVEDSSTISINLYFDVFLFFFNARFILYIRIILISGNCPKLKQYENIGVTMEGLLFSSTLVKF
jgi:hypothetical protein